MLPALSQHRSQVRGFARRGSLGQAVIGSVLYFLTSGVGGLRKVLQLDLV